MVRHIRSLSLAFVTVIALSAVAASAASASNEATYHCAVAPCTLNGTQVGESVLTVPGAGTVSCTTATLSGTQSATTTHELTLHPNYGNCVAFGFANTHVTTTGCDFTLTTATTTVGGGYHAEVHIVCTTGNSIKITPTSFGFSVCTVTVPSGTPIADISDLANNVGPPSDIRVNPTVTGIKHSAGCGASEASDASYTGAVTVKGLNSGGEQVNVSVG